ncbi:MAG: hypothetical protein V1734_03065 [Nanoarchaeota archaeon]
MAPIGFSTGCMYKTSLTLDNIISFYSHIGADALEINFATIKELNDFKPDDDLLETINGFSYVSIHAPFKGITYGDNDFSRHTLKKLQGLCKELPVKGVVIHPDTVDDFNALEYLGIPILIENMDKRKTKGIHPSEFRSYVNCGFNFNFVLDLKHVYEHDSTMALASDFAEAMGNRLEEYHISGHDGTSNHTLLHNMADWQAIIFNIPYTNKKPLIIESVFEDANEFTAKKELEFVKEGLVWLQTH